VKKLIYVVFALLALSACTRYSSSGEKLYLDSRNGVKIQVPYPLTIENMTNFYDLPPQNQNAQVSITTPGL